MCNGKKQQKPMCIVCGTVRPKEGDTCAKCKKQSKSKKRCVDCKECAPTRGYIRCANCMNKRVYEKHGVKVEAKEICTNCNNEEAAQGSELCVDCINNKVYEKFNKEVEEEIPTEIYQEAKEDYELQYEEIYTQYMEWINKHNDIDEETWYSSEELNNDIELNNLRTDWIDTLKEYKNKCIEAYWNFKGIKEID